MLAMTASMTACSAPAADPGAIAAAAQPPASETTYPEYGSTAGKECQERGLGRFLNQRSTAKLAEEARVASRSASVRIIGPRDLVTQDLRRNRLNLTLDAAGKVAGARCF